MRVISNRMKAVLSAVCFSVLGFSVAIATPAPQSGVFPLTGSRAVGGGLQFSNPFLLAGQDAQFPSGGSTANDPSGYDLGDVCLGSQFVRYLSALGGVRPFTFTTTGSPENTAVRLDESGRLVGNLQPGSAQSVNAIVKDAAGVSRLGYFRLFGAATNPGDFRFQIDRLPLARVGMDYVTNVQVSNQDASTVFSVVPQSVFLNGTPLESLEVNGLTLAQDGNLAGRPLNSGTLTFTARATKGARQAFNRSGTTPDQSLAISIGAQSSLQSTLAAVALNFSGDFSGKSVPALTLTAIINKLPPVSTDGQRRHFAFRFGGQTFAATLNGAGFGTTGGGRVSVSNAFNSTLVRLQIRDRALLSVLSSSLADGSRKTLVAELEIGSTYIGTEPIECAVRNRNGRFKLTYNINKDRQQSGLFQVAGAISQDGGANFGSQYRITFLTSNVKGAGSPDYGVPQSANIRIGPGFVQSVPLQPQGRGSMATGFSDQLRVRINPAGKVGTVTTGVLSQDLTNVAPLAYSNNVPQTLLFGADIQTTTQTLSGDSSIVLYPQIVFIIIDPCFDCDDGD